MVFFFCLNAQAGDGNFFPIKETLMKKHLLPLLFALVSLASCSVTSGTDLTPANAKTYFKDPTTTASTPSEKSTGVYESTFQLDPISNGFSDDVKGTATLTVTPLEHRSSATAGQTLTQEMSPIKNVSATFKIHESTASDGSKAYIYADGVFTFNCTLDEGFSDIISAKLSDFVYVTISGSALTA
jgi:hypothetical protein